MEDRKRERLTVLATPVLLYAVMLAIMAGHNMTPVLLHACSYLLSLYNCLDSCT